MKKLLHLIPLVFFVAAAFLIDDSRIFTGIILLQWGDNMSKELRK